VFYSEEHGNESKLALPVTWSLSGSL